MDVKPNQDNLNMDAEWNNLPHGEGISPSGLSVFEGDVTRQEREAQAWAFMARFLERGHDSA